MKKKILIAEDHPLYSKSLRLICESVQFDQLDEVSTCKGVLKALRQQEYTHLILDLTLSDGNAFALLDPIFNTYPFLKILALSSKAAKLYKAKFATYGISYIEKTEPGPQTTERIIRFIENKKSPVDTIQQEEDPFTRLTFKEKQVLHYLLEGHSLVAIAQKMGVQSMTVRTHKMNLMEKTNTRSILELRELADIYQIE